MAQLSRFVAVAVLLGGATVSLSACTGASDPVVSHSPSVSAVATPSPSVSPSPVPLTDDELLALIPEDARAENFGGAVNFARFFLGLYPQLFVADADTTLFASLTGERCGFCANALSDAEETRAAGAHSVGGGIDFPNLTPQGGLRDDGFWYVADDFSVLETQTYGADGALVDGAPGYSGEARFRLAYVDGHWAVDEIDLDLDGV